MYTQSHTSPCYKGRGGELKEPPPRVFDMLQYFETILPSVEHLVWSSKQDEEYFMGGGTDTAGGH